MRLVQIVRYPVKSLQGEVMPEVDIEPDGLRADRRWGIRDEITGRVLTARRAPQLPFGSAVLGADNLLEIELPTGVSCHGPGADTDAALSDWLDRPVSLATSVDAAAAQAEYLADATGEASEAIEWTMPRGGFVDSLPLLVLTTASTRRQPALGEDRDFFRVLARHHGGVFGAWAAVAASGSVRVGDDVDVEPWERP